MVQIDADGNDNHQEYAAVQPKIQQCALPMPDWRDIRHVVHPGIREQEQDRIGRPAPDVPTGDDKTGADRLEPGGFEHEIIDKRRSGQFTLFHSLRHQTSENALKFLAMGQITAYLSLRRIE